jgi:hypothetical protein
MAERSFKKLNRFKTLQIHNIDETIQDLDSKIKAMQNDKTIVVTDEDKKKIRPKMQCSSYVCTKVESHVGAFKVCANCELKFYCSRKCQKQRVSFRIGDELSSKPLWTFTKTFFFSVCYGGYDE